jgi:hypothetical protein
MTDQTKGEGITSSNLIVNASNFFLWTNGVRRQRLRVLFLVVLILLYILTGLSVPVLGQNGSAAAVQEPYSIQNHFFKRFCNSCHESKRKDEFDLSALTENFADEQNRQLWVEVRDQIANGLMPPAEELQPDSSERSKAVQSIETQWIAAIQKEREVTGRVPLRRLSRIEYQNTIRDLLGVEVDVSDLIPEDTVSDGFGNQAESLHVSSFLLDGYLAAADRVLDAAIANGPRPHTINKRFDIRDERTVKAKGSVYRHEADGVAVFSSWVSANIQVTMWQFNTRGRGKYRFRISAYGIQTDKPVTFYVKAGPMNAAAEQYLIGYFSVPPNEPKVIEFVENMESNLTIRIVVDGLGVTPPQVEKIGAENYKGPGLLIQHVDIEGPIHEVWPPESHQRIFGELKQSAIASQGNRREVVSETPQTDAQEILSRFARRAFRREISDADIQPFLIRFERLQKQGRSFEESIRVALKGILLSPEFLFLRESVGDLDNFALASRLSYFLWSSMPDEELFILALQGKLKDLSILHQQVERMLEDPKSAAFKRNFVDQWLGLQAIDDTSPDAMLYPEYDDLLKVSMLKEIELFFDEVFRNDLSIANFIDSDFTYLNGRLARHYGIKGVPEGVEFQKVSLPSDSPRGGILTTGAVLKVTANGTTTSPIIRGNWLLSRILDRPPPKPPENIEAVEPDIRGATTIRNQLAKHRDLPQCAGCHRIIDPHGFAFENFDVIGGWREYYRSIGEGAEVTQEGRRMRYRQGPLIEIDDELVDGRKFNSVEAYKQLLLSNQDELAAAFAGKLLSYATGGKVGLADRADIDTIVQVAREKKFGLRSMIHAVIDSHAFRKK